MNTDQAIVLGIGLILVAAATVWEVSAGIPTRIYHFPKAPRAEITIETIQIGLERPILWIFLNDSETNSRHWLDFMARSSHVINVPLLNLCYQTIVNHNGDDYRIEVIGGLQDVARLLGGWEALPTLMRNPKTTINLPEKDWIRTAILAKFGGLWLSPSVVCLKPFGKLPNKIVAFGQDQAPMYGSAVPGFRALWSPFPKHPIFVEWEKRIRDRMDYQTGGRQVRGDAKSDWVELTDGDDVEFRTIEELSRDPKTNKSLDLEHIFASSVGSIDRMPFTVPECAVYMPIPKDLMDRRAFGWVLRSSEEQIMESDIAIRYILEKALTEIH